jgi:magnesium-transporting ATPase (P-type)
VPKNFNEILTSYAKQGYRVLALAYKPLELNYVKIQRIERLVKDEFDSFRNLF